MPVTTETRNANPKTVKSRVTAAPGSDREKTAVDELDRAIGEQQAQHAAETRQQDALGHRLAQQPRTPAPSAARTLCSRMRAALRTSWRFGKVGAGDEQHEASKSEREPHDASRHFA